jgi:DedD protein
MPLEFHALTRRPLRCMRFPFFRTQNPAPSAGATRVRSSVDDALPVDAVRTRARRRLMGALALLVVGVLGFPMLFDTQPRPMSGDLPMEVVRRDGSVAPSTAGGKVNKPLPVTTVPSDAGIEVAAPAAAAASAAAPPIAARPATAPAAAVVEAAVVAPKPVPVPVVAAKPAPAVVPVAGPTTAPAAVAAKPPKPLATAASAAAPGRFVVQVGAYSALAPMREARAKVEKLGLKTYTQVIETDAGPRTRLRVGPFDSREQADAAADKLKRANLPSNILTL